MNSILRQVVMAVAGIWLPAALAAEPHAVLRLVEERITPVLTGLVPEPTVHYPEYSQSLIVSYRPQKFTVHERSKTGEWSTNTFEKVGPSFTGFILKVHLQRLGELNQIAVPWSLQEPYWRTFLEVTPIGGTTNQIYWALSSAGRTDEKLLAGITNALQSLSGMVARGGANHQGPADVEQPPSSETNRASEAAAPRRSP